MAKKRKSILNDPRWQKIAIRYRNDRVGFATEFMGHDMSAQQREVLKAMDRDGARVSVASGHGTGKSFLAGDLVIHHMICHVEPELILTANNIDQVRRVVFKYVSKAWALTCSRHPWLKKYFTITSENFYCNEFKKSWYTVAKTVPKDRPEGIAGAHNKNLMFIVDEAAGVPDEVLSVIKGALSEDNNKLLLFSQPTRNTGEFYDSHHSKKKLDPDDPNDSGYISIRMNSEESKYVTVKAIREYIKSYGGTDTPEYQIKVKGLFSDQLEGFLISRRLSEKAQSNKVQLPEEWGTVLVADVGGGVERDSSTLAAFKIGGYFDERVVEPIWVKEMPKTMAADEFGHEIYEASLEFDNCSIAVDAVGIGLQTCQVLDRKGVAVQRIMWGAPCHSQAHKDRFINERAYCYVSLRDGLMSSRVKLDGSKQIVEQASRIPYRLNERGQYQMTSKEQMRSMGIKSPDWADLYAMAMMADYVPDYSQGEVGGDGEEDDYLEDMIRAATQ